MAEHLTQCFVNLPDVALAAHQYTLYKHVEGTTYRRISSYHGVGDLYGAGSMDTSTVVAYLNGFLNGFLAGSTLKTPAAGVNRGGA